MAVFSDRIPPQAELSGAVTLEVVGSSVLIRPKELVRSAAFRRLIHSLTNKRLVLGCHLDLGLAKEPKAADSSEGKARLKAWAVRTRWASETTAAVEASSETRTSQTLA